MLETDEMLHWLPSGHIQTHILAGNSCLTLHKIRAESLATPCPTLVLLFHYGHAETPFDYRTLQKYVLKLSQNHLHNDAAANGTMQARGFTLPQDSLYDKSRLSILRENSTYCTIRYWICFWGKMYSSMNGQNVRSFPKTFGEIAVLY